MRSRQEVTSHWRRDIKTPALHEINLETAKRNNVKAEKTMPGIFIGNCLVKPKISTSSISVINITKEQVIPMPLVTSKKIKELLENVTPDTTETYGASNAT